jgi:hypothetical protein
MYENMTLEQLNETRQQLKGALGVVTDVTASHVFGTGGYKEILREKWRMLDGLID